MKYFSYLSQFDLSSILLFLQSGNGILVILILAFAFWWLFFKILNLSKSDSLIFSIVLIFLTITIMDYNVRYDSGNFKFSSYNTGSNQSKILVSDRNTPSKSNNNYNNQDTISLEQDYLNDSSSNQSKDYEKTLKIISDGINLFKDLSKNPNWEEKDIPFNCRKCGKAFTARGYYKETTNEFKPTVDFPTEWFHTHEWVILK